MPLNTIENDPRCAENALGNTEHALADWSMSGARPRSSCRHSLACCIVVNYYSTVPTFAGLPGRDIAFQVQGMACITSLWIWKLMLHIA
eukprot:3663449-Pleurochrysis_carterae.AAC.1